MLTFALQLLVFGLAAYSLADTPAVPLPVALGSLGAGVAVAAGCAAVFGLALRLRYPERPEYWESK